MARLNPTLKWNEGLPKSFLYLIISAKNFCDDHISGIVSTNLFSHWLQQNSHSLQQVGTLGNQASMVHLFKIYYNIILEMETFKISSAYFDTINIHQYAVFVFLFLTYFTLCNRLQVHPPHQSWLRCIPFYRRVIFHCVYVPQLSYPFVCWWTYRLLPCPGYYKQCCNEHWGTRVSFNSGFLGVYAQQWDCWVIWQFYSQYFKESSHCSP